jgi:hypothetical protein
LPPWLLAGVGARTAHGAFVHESPRGAVVEQDDQRLGPAFSLLSEGACAGPFAGHHLRQSELVPGPGHGGEPRAVRSGGGRRSGDEMTWWVQILAVWAPFVVIAMLVIAVAAANDWIERRSEREHQYGANRKAAQQSTQAPRSQPAEVLSETRPGQPSAVAQPLPHPPSHRREPVQPLPPASTEPPPETPAVSTAELRRWARQTGLRVADRGPIPAHVREAWLRAQQAGEPGASLST